MAGGNNNARIPSLSVSHFVADDIEITHRVPVQLNAIGAANSLEVHNITRWRGFTDHLMVFDNHPVGRMPGLTDGSNPQIISNTVFHRVDGDFTAGRRNHGKNDPATVAAAQTVLRLQDFGPAVKPLGLAHSHQDA